jgi:hypothetical protein
MTRVVVAIIGLLASFSATAQSWPPPPVGVYACHGQRGLAFPMMFGLLDDSTYANYDGATGRYRYDLSSGLLTMLDGPMAGVKYQRVGAPTVNPGFRMLDDKGQLTAYICPKDGNKDPRKRPW